MDASGDLDVRPLSTRAARGGGRGVLFALGLLLFLIHPAASDVSSRVPQVPFSRDALDLWAPVVREETYQVDARVRPLLLFWIGRDDIGDARITWRQGAGGRRTLELLVGSDPARAPRRINRWGFIVEEFTAETGEVLGVMKDSSEQTLEEAEAKVESERDGDDASTFKVVRTTVNGDRAVTGTHALRAPADLSYHQLEDLLRLLPPEPRARRTLELPTGTEKGFLIAMTAMISASAGPCRTGRRQDVRKVATVPYLYNQTLYDLSLTSCEHRPEWRSSRGSFSDVIDGRFQVRNRRTGHVTKFQLAYGMSEGLRGVPVRIVFRPRWWMELELVLRRDAEIVDDAAARNGGRT